MARIAGIQVERSIKGLATIIRVDLRKQPDLIPFFIERGIITEDDTSPYNKKFVEKILSQKDAEAVTINTEDLWK